MRVLRGRAADREADDAVTGELLARAAENEERGLRVWRPHRQLAFGRRDARADGYRRAREIAIDRGFPPVERRTGGRAVAHTEGTVAIALARPIADVRGGIDERYDAAATAVQRALWRLGVPAQRGEPADTFCPGGRALQWDGKLAGFAQRVQQGVALVAGIVIVRDREAIADVLDPVYAALDVPFDPASVDSVERAGGRDDPGTVAREIEAALVGDRAATIERIDGD